MISFEFHLEKWHEKAPKPLWFLGFFEPISFSVRIVGCGGGTFFSRAQQSTGLLLPRLRGCQPLTLGVRFKSRLPKKE